MTSTLLQTHLTTANLNPTQQTIVFSYSYLFSLGTSLPSSSTAAMTMSASAKFHHNTEESPSQTPCCSPTPQDIQK
uniref:Ovule protein n=1 Tax=Ditylenchus dipsaci TaxID=166011 RepID=A0A915CLJ3_9BILA